jgi:hypothetical protein
MVIIELIDILLGTPNRQLIVEDDFLDGHAMTTKTRCNHWLKLFNSTVAIGYLTFRQKQRAVYRAYLGFDDDVMLLSRVPYLASIYRHQNYRRQRIATDRGKKMTLMQTWRQEHITQHLLCYLLSAFNILKSSENQP